MRTLPLVSIITPTTHDRAWFNERMYRIVASQDYPNIEHVVSYDQSKVLGAKMNDMIASCKGDIIVNIDSDDLYASDWVSRMVSLLLETGADVAGLKRAYFYKEPEVWTYTYPAHDKCLFGATMAHTKAFWERNPYMTKQVGYDVDFTQKNCTIAVSDYTQGFVATVHAGNVSPKNMTGERWKRVDDVVELIIKQPA